MFNFGVIFLLVTLLFTFSGCNSNFVAAEQPAAKVISKSNPLPQAPTEQEIKTKGINVKQFGAKGNGIADDTAAFQKALASLTGGQILRVPAGVYNVNQLMLPSSVVIAGDKGAVLQGTTAGETVLIIGAHNVILCGLTIDGNRKSKQAIKINANSYDIHIEKCEIKNTYGDEKSGSWAVSMLKGGKNITIRDCYFHDISGPENGIDGDNVGANRAILAFDVESMAIVNCTFAEIRGFEDGDCIQISAAATADDNKWKYSDVTIRDCTFKSFYKRAIKVQASGVKIVHNTITANPAANPEEHFQAAISIFGGDNVIDSNTIVLFRARLGIDLNGINCKVVNNNIAVHNTGSSKRTAGIYVSAKGSYSTVEKNKVSNIPDAIEVNKATTKVSVRNNIVQ
jgi:pectate lyase